MREAEANNKLVGMIGIILGAVFLSSLFFIDRNKLIIPVSELFFVKYFILISMINGGLCFVIAGVWIFMGGVLNPAYVKTKIEKAKRYILSILLLSPFLISFFTTIFVVSTSNFWKILGSLALAYVVWLLYTNVRVLLLKAK
jgi:hypothetical protein